MSDIFGLLAQFSLYTCLQSQGLTVGTTSKQYEMKKAKNSTQQVHFIRLGSQLILFFYGEIKKAKGIQCLTIDATYIFYCVALVSISVDVPTEI